MARKKDDTDFLKEYVGNSTTPTTTGKPKDESAIGYLEDLTADTPASQQPSTARQERLQRRAEKADAADTERKRRQELRDEQARLDQIEQDRVDQARTLNDRIQRGISRTGDAISPTIDKVGAMPTIGGIGLLLVILAILLFLVVRVNDAGDTRAKQVWYMLNGRASLQGSVKPSGVSNSSTVAVIPGGASSDFGTPTSDTVTSSGFRTNDLLGF